MVFTWLCLNTMKFEDDDSQYIVEVCVIDANTRTR